MKPYLLLYNLVSAVGWAVVLNEAVSAFRRGDSPTQAWDAFGQTLLVVQSLAGLEVLHSVLKFVRSPVATTLMQVSSRYGVMWCFTYLFQSSSSHWSLYLMVISWSLVEVPRYLFYAFNLYMVDVPFVLFWLRYSLFAILYPTGISGEILQILQALPALKVASIPAWYLTLGVLLMYLPGGPFMIFHMFQQRKKAFKARKEKGNKATTKAGPPPSEGIDFPLDEATNQRSTTIVNQGAFVASIRGVDEAAANAAQKERNWRFGYAKHIVKNVELSCASNAQSVKIARQGLTYLHKNFVYVQPSTGESKSVEEIMKSTATFEYTYEITGTATADIEYYVPYQKFGSKKVNNLKGEALKSQLETWVQRGTIEADTMQAILNVATKPENYTKNLKDKYFVLLGAGSAMGPLRVLLELGANVIAIDIDRDFVWKRLIDMARTSRGRMIFPIKKPASEIKDDTDLAKNAGADLLKQTPAIANWIAAQQPGKQLILGGYAYLDSALFVRLAIAMDAIMDKVLETRKNAAIAFLCSPTDVFVCENACREQMVKQLKRAPLWQKLLRLVLPKNMLSANAIPQVTGTDGSTYSLVNGLVVAQGPNYALAKRLQHWRCVLARENGHTVSTNIAPSTATASVVSNASFAAAYIGMGLFKPLEIVYQDLSNSIMTALLIHDVVNPDSFANPKNKLDNQMRLFAKTSAHFGIWRMAFKSGSIGEVSALVGYASIYSRFLYVVLAGFMAFLGLIYQKGFPHTW